MFSKCGPGNRRQQIRNNTIGTNRVFIKFPYDPGFSVLKPQIKLLINRLPPESIKGKGGIGEIA